MKLQDYLKFAISAIDKAEQAGNEKEIIRLIEVLIETLKSILTERE